MAIDVTFFANGFSYESEEDELDAVKHHMKIATTLDMQVIAVNTKATTSFAIGSLSELVAKLGESADTVSRVRILGHSNGDDLAFAGSIDTSTGQVLWPEAIHVMNKESIEVNRKFIREVTAKRFLKDTEVWLYGCHSGNYAMGKLGQATADIFGVMVRGFRRPIDVCVVLKTEGREAYRISERGWFRIASRFQEGKPCVKQGFVRDLDKLVPETPFRPQPPKEKAKQ